MKARDIIPGWPRGKSTSGPTPDYTDYRRYRPGHAPRAIHSVWFICDEIAEERYHAGQQAMVDRYRHGEITPPLFFHEIEPLTNAEKVENWRRLLQEAERYRSLNLWANHMLDYYSFYLR